jgi:molybdate transport system ATP-binding protein
VTRTLAQASQPLISLSNCSIVLGGTAVLDAATFDLHAGQRWALVGPNGSGKTLLLKLLRGEMWPTPTGMERREYCFDGELSEQPFGAKEHIAYVGPERQDKYVRYEWNHTVTQVVTTGVFDEDIPRTQPSARQRQRVTRLLKQFRLWSLRGRSLLTLSYGQRRRALVARAFAGQPQVLLLDEVFNGLDTASARILRNAIHRTRGVGSTWIVTTHREHDVPANTTHVARMHAGKVTTEKKANLVNTVKGSRALRAASPMVRPTKQSSGTTSQPLIKLCNVDLYRDYRLVLRDVNWTLLRGEHWGIVGPNGAGKSTLLKLLYGDLHPRLGGVIERDGVPFGTPIIEWKRRVGVVSPELQADYYLARDLAEVVMSGRYSSIGLNAAPTRSDCSAARKWLKYFGIDALAHRHPRAVSYGQMRLALLARAMINKPQLLLLDEPCTGLDPDMRAMVIAVLSRLAMQGVQLVMAVHDTADMPACVGRLLAIQRDRSVEKEDR